MAEKLLAYNPATRITAAQALEAPYFKTEEPSECMPEYVSQFNATLTYFLIYLRLSSLDGEWHEFESKREKRRRQRQEV